MKSTTATVSLLALAASSALAQQTSYDGKFQFAKFNLTGQNIPAQGVVECKSDPILELKDGILTDQLGRVGNVVANDQLQFDPGEGQPDAKDNSGFEVYSNGSLALNGDAIWYSCNSGSFDNLYDRSIAPYCVPVYLVTYPCSGSGTGVSSASSVVSSVSMVNEPTASTPASTSAAVSSSEAPSTTAVPTTSASIPSAPGPVVSASAPYPVGNDTIPAGTASSSSVATTTAGSNPASSTSAAPFPGAASTVAVGGNFVAVLAGLVAFALF